MAYFSKFPTIYYPFIINGKEEIKVVTDITRNVRAIKATLENIKLYEIYDIQDGETPEIISDKLYGTPLYHWVLMVINDKYDYISDFPLSQPELMKFIRQKYGEGNEYDTHHYVNSDGFIVSAEQEGAVSVSNFQYEDQINESKRSLKIVSPAMMSRIVSQFEDII